MLWQYIPAAAECTRYHARICTEQRFIIIQDDGWPRCQYRVDAVPLYMFSEEAHSHVLIPMN